MPTTMYPAKINSPMTLLSAAITAAATTVPVDDADLLPDAPNLATIGRGEDCETIYYGAKNGDSLTSVTRGFQGDASAWVLGDSVYRAFAAYDHDAFKSNIEELQPIEATGSADNVIIQAAIDAAIAAGGGEVKLAKGTFVLSSRLQLDDNITLSGSGWATILQAAADIDSTSGNTGCIQIKRQTGVATDSVIIRDLQIDANKANVVSAYISGIHLHYMTNTIIENVLAKNGKNFGIFVTTDGASGVSSNVIIKNCIGTANDWDGIAYTSNNGIIESCMGYSNGRSGITLEESNSTSVINCIGYSNAGAGIDIVADGDSNKIIGGYYFSNTQQGIAIDRNDGVIMSNVHTYSNTLHGIYLLMSNNLTIDACHIYSNGQWGVFCAGTSPYCSNVSVNNSQIYNNTHDGVGGTSVAETFSIKNNNVFGNRRGIYTQYCADVLIDGNNVHDNTYHGIQYRGCTGRGIINNNRIFDNGTGTSNTYQGIYLDGAGNAINNTSIIGNNISGSDHQYAILEEGTTDYSLITDNIVGTGATGTILIVGANTVARDNIGYVTENSGTATLLNANTTIVVAHGCAATPTFISITWAENPTNVIADWWVDTIGATNFTLNGVDPGASNLDFMWRAEVS